MNAPLALLAFVAASHVEVDHTSRSASCARCHARTTAAYALSGHSQARASFVFEAAIAADEPRWCVSCHAPQSTTPPGERAPSDAGVDERGIGCASCHATALEPIRMKSELCAQCHQFGFLRRSGDGRVLGLTEDSIARDAQQNTFAEWLAWSSSTGDARTCQSCHMENGDHTFGGVRRIEALRRALVVEQVDRDTLRLSARDTGHLLPTGDIMRYISVETASDDSFDADVTIVARFRRDLALRVWPGEDAPRLGVARDRRIPWKGAATVDVPRGARFWRVTYHLVSEDQERREIVPPDVSSIEVMRGELR